MDSSGLLEDMSSINLSDSIRGKFRMSCADSSKRKRDSQRTSKHKKNKRILTEIQEKPTRFGETQQDEGQTTSSLCSQYQVNNNCYGYKPSTVYFQTNERLSLGESEDNNALAANKTLPHDIIRIPRIDNNPKTIEQTLSICTPYNKDQEEGVQATKFFVELAGKLGYDEAEEIAKPKCDGSRSINSPSSLESEIQIKKYGKIKWSTSSRDRMLEIWHKMKNMAQVGKLVVKSEDLIADNTGKCWAVVILGVAGAGKSYLLSHLCLLIQQSFPSHTASVIHFPDVVQELIESANAVDFVARLESSCPGTILFDGLDEISSQLQQKAIRLMKELYYENKVNRIYVAARPHLKAQLQDAFFQFAYDLSEFDEQDQLDYFDRHCKNGKGILRTVYKEQLGKLRSSATCQVIGIPLQCSMLATCCNHRQIERNDLQLIEGDVTKLYQRFITCFVEKCYAPTTRTRHLPNESQIYHRLVALALETIAPETDHSAQLLGPCEIQQANSKQDWHYKCIGLLTKSSKDRWQLNHKTYADYLVADYVRERLVSDDEPPSDPGFSKRVSSFIIETVLVDERYEGVRVFLDMLLKSVSKQGTSYVDMITKQLEQRELFDKRFLKTANWQTGLKVARMNKTDCISKLLFYCISIDRRREIREIGNNGIT